MMHVAEAKVEGLGNAHRTEKTDTGYKFSPEDSKCRIMISGGSEYGTQAYKLMIYGGTSTQEAEFHIERLKERVEAEGGEFELAETPYVTNLAVSGELDIGPLDLEGLSVEMTQEGLDLEYEPEQFPALQFYMEAPDCTFLLFSTGSYVIQGLRDQDDIPVALDKLEEVLDR